MQFEAEIELKHATLHVVVDFGHHFIDGMSTGERSVVRIVQDCDPIAGPESALPWTAYLSPVPI